MERLEKALGRLSRKERRQIQEVLQKISARSWKGLDIQKLKGSEDIFRVRKGNFRVICRERKDGNTFVLAIERRSEKTYRKF